MNGIFNENAKGTAYACCIILLFDLSDRFKLSYCISLLIEYNKFNVQQSQGLFFLGGEQSWQLPFFLHYSPHRTPSTQFAFDDEEFLSRPNQPNFGMDPGNSRAQQQDEPMDTTETVAIEQR